MLNANHKYKLNSILIGYACRADKNPYRHDRRADKNPYRHYRRADKNTYRHDRRADSQCHTKKPPTLTIDSKGGFFILYATRVGPYKYRKAPYTGKHF